jgi:DNA invertase Pin-like site-specific DNA recombinase
VAAIYARISLDRNGESEAPDRQVEACRKSCEAKGWDVAEVFIDRDKSAWAQTDRPAFNQVLATARDGRVTAIVFWKLDRFTRRVAELAPLAREFHEAGVALVSVDDSIDTSTPYGRFFAHLVAALAEMESENTSERKKAKNAYDAQRGRYFKGGHRAFGRNLDGTVIPDEAAAITEVARRYVDGESLGSLARWLNAEGLSTTAGGAWTGTTLSRTLRQPHLRGVRRHNGEQYAGEFEEILDEWTATQIAERVRQQEPSARNGFVHFLSGLARCGVCGHRLGYGSVKNRDGTRFPKYACRSGETASHCGKVGISMRSADVEVTRRVIAKLTEQRTNLDSEGLDDAWGLLAVKVQNDEGALDEMYRERYIDRTLPEEVYQRLRVELQTRIVENCEEIYRIKRVLAGRQILADQDPTAAWEQMPVPQRKLLLRRLISEIRVLPVGKGGNRFRPERIEIDWTDAFDW